MIKYNDVNGIYKNTYIIYIFDTQIYYKYGYICIPYDKHLITLYNKC